MARIQTSITEMFGIQHPILLAGYAVSSVFVKIESYALIFSMNVASGPELVAAVTNAGGLGVIGGLGYSPKMLREQVSICSMFFCRVHYETRLLANKPSRQIQATKALLKDKDAPYGVDLALPKVGDGARKTNVRTCLMF